MATYQTDKLTERIICCVIRVHQKLGPGFLEHIYQRAVLIELRKQDLATEVETEFTIYYEGHEVGRHKLDLIVEREVIVELKTVVLGKAQYAQVRSYLKPRGFGSPY